MGAPRSQRMRQVQTQIHSKGKHERALNSKAADFSET